MTTTPATPAEPAQTDATGTGDQPLGDPTPVLIVVIVLKVLGINWPGYTSMMASIQPQAASTSSRRMNSAGFPRSTSMSSRS